jgi:hypothetical protein
LKAVVNISSAALRALLVWALCLSLAFNSSHAEQPDAAEYKVKAAFLYKFGAYVEWPAQAFTQADSPIVIGVMGANTVADELAQMSAGRTINGHSVSVKKLHQGDPLMGLHILFIARTGNDKLADTLAVLKGQAVLVVTETTPPPAPGSVINFVVADDKVRFDIALPSADSSSIKLSARLLTVARKVIAGPS